jgi:hypothetical protein
MSDKKNNSTLLMVGGAVVGSALGGSLLGGIPVMDVAMSLQGSLGFLLGHGAGMLIAQDDSKSWAPFLAAVAVPLIAGGVVDRAFLGVVGGGLAGIYLSGAHSEFKL